MIAHDLFDLSLTGGTKHKADQNNSPVEPVL